jgi:hypothetical protein
LHIFLGTQAGNPKPAHDSKALVKSHVKLALAAGISALTPKTSEKFRRLRRVSKIA